jgi:DASS family divalent anion:Na+ symporter
MLIIFVATMVSVMAEVMPLCGSLFISLLFCGLTNTINLKTQGFTGFSSYVPWLLFLVVAISKAITKSTIGIRIAYFFVRIFGKNIIGLAYSISLTEMVLATILPSNTARGASVGLPLVTSLSKYIGSSIKGASEKSVGAFLSFVYTCSNSICSAMFLTAMVSNAIIADIALKNGMPLNWITWAKYTIIPCSIILFIMPIALYFLTPPKVKELESVYEDAKQKAKDLGPFSTKEKCVIGVICGMLSMWILAEVIGISIMTTTLLG